MTLGGGSELPPGWGQGEHNGQTYYVNHVTKQTQWTRPSATAAPPAAATMPPPPPPPPVIQQQQYAPTSQPAVPVVMVAGGLPPAYSGAVTQQGRTPVECNTTFWITAGLSWIIWMFGVSAFTSGNWFCDDTSCAGVAVFGDVCDDSPEYGVCDKSEGLFASQLIATLVISIAVIIFTVAFFRRFDAGCCSSKKLGFCGGVLMAIFVVLQTTAVAFGVATKDEMNNEPDFNLDVSLGESFDVAVSGLVFGLIQAIVVFALFRRAGDGPAVGRCCSSNGLPIRTPRVQQPSKQQYTAGA